MCRIIFTAAFFIALNSVHPTCSYYVQLKLYEHIHCQGREEVYDLDRNCYSFAEYPDHYGFSAFRMPIGSCAKIFRSQSCRAETFTIRYPNWEYCELPDYAWNDRIFSISDCETRISTIVCPEGSYVREITYSSESATQGITVSCFEPTRTGAKLTQNTHGRTTITNPKTVRCPIAAFGLSAVWNQKWQILDKPSLSCQRSLMQNSRRVTQTQYPLLMERPKPNYNRSLSNENHRSSVEEVIRASCGGQHDALVGLEAIIDECIVDYIKDLFYYCSEVPNPALVCEPIEHLTTVVTCDNRGSQSGLQCPYLRTTGVGLSRTLTETEEKEYNWSREAGFEINANIGRLGASMSAKLGHSELVEYEWSVSDSTTWREEFTGPATVTAEPYTRTDVLQLTAKCAFHSVHVNYFKAIDTDRNGVVSTRYFKT